MSRAGEGPDVQELEIDRLRAEVARMQAYIASDDAKDSLELTEARAALRAERERVAELERKSYTFETNLAHVRAELAAEKQARAEAEADTARLDWLEGEVGRENLAVRNGRPMPNSIFRRNQRITRAAIDAARAAEPHK